MTLLDLTKRHPMDAPFAEGANIPWSDPGFSSRMLKEHLSQSHDAASRRSQRIKGHVDWIHREVLSGIGTSVIDLGCGPGLYTAALAALGHECVGIDYSPASISYARSVAIDLGLPCRYVESDLRQVDFGGGFGLAMMVFGEFNTFRPVDAHNLLKKCCSALRPGGTLLLEPHSYGGVQRIGEQGTSWQSVESGLFSDRPHLVLVENRWLNDVSATVTRFCVVDACTSAVTQFGRTMQAYSDEDYRRVLAEAGFDQIRVFPGMGDDPDAAREGLLVITARRP